MCVRVCQTAPAGGMAAVAHGRAVAWKRMDSADVDMHLPDVCSGSGVDGAHENDRVTTIQVGSHCKYEGHGEWMYVQINGWMTQTHRDMGWLRLVGSLKL